MGLNGQLTPVKFADGTDDTLRILACPVGGPFLRNGKGSDLDGERFHKNTDYCLNWFTGDHPLLFDHGHEANLQVSPVGYWPTKSVAQDDQGLWIQAQLDRNNEYFGAITELVRQGKLFASSGAMGHLCQVKSNGDIDRWPLIEVSLTPTPSNFTAQVGFDTILKHYKSAGLDFEVSEEISQEDVVGMLKGVKSQLKVLKARLASEFECDCLHCKAELKAELSNDERDSLSDSDFAYIDSDGGRHLPIQDKAHVSNAISRFGQTHFESDAAKKKAAKKILARARKLDIEVSDDSAVAKAAKGFFSLLLLTDETEDEELKAHVKVLQESVDTSGGFLVPEDTEVRGTEEKKPTEVVTSSTEEPEPAKKDAQLVIPLADLLDPQGLVKSITAVIEAARPGTVAVSTGTSVEAQATKDVEGVIVLRDSTDKGVVLIPKGKSQEGATEAAKAGEIIPAAGRYGQAPEGSVEDWICDLRCAANRGLGFAGMMGEYGYVDIVATFGFNGPGYAVACCYSYDDDGDCYFRLDFDLGPDGVDPIITNVAPYAAVYVPLDQLPSVMTDDDDPYAMGKSIMPYKMHVAFVNLAAKALAHRTEGFVQERSKEGRVLSSANRKVIGDFLEQWEEVGTSLRVLYDSTEPQAKAKVLPLKRELEAISLEFEAMQLEGVA